MGLKLIEMTVMGRNLWPNIMCRRRNQSQFIRIRLFLLFICVFLLFFFSF